MRNRSLRRTVAGLAAVAAISGALALATASPAQAAPATATGTPVVLDGVRYNPTDPALRSAGSLHYVVDQQAQKQGVVYAFRTEREALARLAATNATATPTGTVSPQGSGVVEIFSETNGYGDWLTQGPNTYQGNLGLVGRGCFLWWCNGTWNDVISSLRTNGRAVVLYRDINLTGQSIYFGSWVSANLTDYAAPDGINWNDQASSLYVYS
jgi:hypothetical protein